MFGQSVEKLLLYLAPLQAEDLENYGYSESALGELLSEKAAIVFSYMPEKYRRAYAARVNRLIVVDFAKSGQTSVAAPFPSMSSVIGFVNPSGSVQDLRDYVPISVTVSLSNLNFTALSLGDKLIIDFDNVLAGTEILSLIWACNVLASIDLLSIIAGDSRTGAVVERVKLDGDRVFNWLTALNSPVSGDRVIIKELEYNYWDGDKTFLSVLDEIVKNKAASI